MAERGYGRIVNITSIHGEVGEETALSYDVAKAGLNQATRTLAIELGPSAVLVNAVAPGFVSTRMSKVDGRNARCRHIAGAALATAARSHSAYGQAGRGRRQRLRLRRRSQADAYGRENS